MTLEARLNQLYFASFEDDEDYRELIREIPKRPKDLWPKLDKHGRAVLIRIMVASRIPFGDDLAKAIWTESWDFIPEPILEKWEWVEQGWKILHQSRHPIRSLDIDYKPKNLETLMTDIGNVVAKQFNTILQSPCTELADCIAYRGREYFAPLFLRALENGVSQRKAATALYRHLVLDDVAVECLQLYFERNLYPKHRDRSPVRPAV